jgi:hypothetical protein
VLHTPISELKAMEIEELLAWHEQAVHILKAKAGQS